MEQNSEIKHREVETYADDMASLIESDNSLVKKIIEGEEEKEAVERISSPEAKRDKIFMWASIALMLIALSTIAYFLLRKDNSVVPAEQQFVPIVFTDKNIFLEVAGLKKEEIMHTIAGEVETTTVKNGGVEGIYLTQNKRIAGLRKFIILMGASFVPDKDPLVVGDNFLMGIVNGATSKDFFILIKSRSTIDIFDSMRAWENKMFSELAPLFEISVNSDNKYLLTKDFEDGIVENKNARILNDKDGKPAMMYIFADDNSVIIGSSRDAIHEIMLRLASSQLKR